MEPVRGGFLSPRTGRSCIQPVPQDGLALFMGIFHGTYCWSWTWFLSLSTFWWSSPWPEQITGNIIITPNKYNSIWKVQHWYTFNNFMYSWSFHTANTITGRQTSGSQTRRVTESPMGSPQQSSVLEKNLVWNGGSNLEDLCGASIMPYASNHTTKISHLNFHFFLIFLDRHCSN